MVFIEVIEFTINQFGTLNEATKSIRIIPVVVFKDKENVSLKLNDVVEVTGTVIEFKSSLEIEAKTIKVF